MEIGAEPGIKDIKVIVEKSSSRYDLLYIAAQCVVEIGLQVPYGHHLACLPFKSLKSVGAAATCAACAWNLSVSPNSSQREQVAILLNNRRKEKSKTNVRWTVMCIMSCHYVMSFLTLHYFLLL